MQFLRLLEPLSLNQTHAKSWTYVLHEVSLDSFGLSDIASEPERPSSAPRGVIGDNSRCRLYHGRMTSKRSCPGVMAQLGTASKKEISLVQFLYLCCMDF